MIWLQEKLIRDKIWERILGSHESKSIRIVESTVEKVEFLIQKLTEELSEFHEADKIYRSNIDNHDGKKDSIYEAADVLEVIDTLIAIEGSDSIYSQAREEFIAILNSQHPEYRMEDILFSQKEKREKLWGFDIGYILALPTK